MSKSMSVPLQAGVRKVGSEKTWMAGVDLHTDPEGRLSVSKNPPWSSHMSLDTTSINFTHHVGMRPTWISAIHIRMPI